MNPKPHSLICLLRVATVDIKRALQGLHEGPGAKPRDQVHGPLGLGKDLYSKWLNTEELDRLPPLMYFLAIGNITDDPEPLAALARHWGSGYRVVPLVAHEATPAESQSILAQHAGPSGSLSAALSAALAGDNIIDAGEARATLRQAQDNLVAAQRTLAQLQRLTESL